ncbi:MAG: hypothetical protein AAES65_03050 [Candidatus Thiodiazotropha sp. (ex. Lucinoma kazani)]
MIECYPYTVTDLDTGYWVPVEEFLCHFDQEDLINNRDAKNVVDAYSHEWFYSKVDENLMFELPTIHMVSDKTQFISGRHKTSVLLKHLDILPIAFYQNALPLANSLKLKPIDLSKSIELPSLPMRNY